MGVLIFVMVVLYIMFQVAENGREEARRKREDAQFEYQRKLQQEKEDIELSRLLHAKEDDD